jgi:hypothetical protein
MKKSDGVCVDCGLVCGEELCALCEDKRKLLQ